MTDNDLIKLFLPIINASLIVLGYSNVAVKQNYQPTAQGANTGPTVYFNLNSSRPYGFLQRFDEWNEAKEEMIHTEKQLWLSTFQISALVRQDPAVTNSYTSSDLASSIIAIMQSDAARETLSAANVGIFRISDLMTNLKFNDDRDQFEAMPSFDFTLSYYRTITSEIPVIESVEEGIFRV